MKHLHTKLSRFYLNILMILVASAMLSCDRCKEVECKNDGVCEKGICECSEKFRGDLCTQQRQPRSITVTKVMMEGVGQFVNDEWDTDGSLPDILLGIQMGTETYYAFTSEELYENSDADQFTFEEGLSLKIETQTEVVRFSLLDLDNGYVEEVFWCTTVLYHSKNGLPDIYEFEYASGAKITVWMEYEF